MTFRKAKEFGVGLALALVLGSALITCDFALHWPASDDRARLYFLLWAAPLAIGGPYLAASIIAPVVGLVVTGWRTRWAAIGSIAGAVMVWVALYLGIFSWTVWVHPEDVPPHGPLTRILSATTLAVTALLVAKWRAFKASTGLSSEAAT